MDCRRRASTREKLALLHTSLTAIGKVAVAYSGGVDSTLLLYLSVKSLGVDNVLALHGVSCLVSRRHQDKAETFFRKLFRDSIELRKIPMEPLTWKGFRENSPRRCYHCKKEMYKRFLIELIDIPGCSLVDGTNADDSAEYRPGMDAIRELPVATPLLEAGLTKAEIRFLAEEAGLPNHSEPSESCLATRIETGMMIGTNLLKDIEHAEIVLENAGFSGTRFRMYRGCIHLEIKEQDMERFCCKENRDMVQKYAEERGLGKVFLSLTCR